MTAGLFFHGGGAQDTPNRSPEPQAGSTPPLESGTGGKVATSAEPGPWTPVCRYIVMTGQEAPSPSVNLELKLDGSGGKNNLRGNFSLSGNVAEKEREPKSQFCLTPDWHVSALIATVPNPELTHLSLTFDRYVESITWAVSDGDLRNESYTFDSYWFPWRPDQKEETEPEKRKSAEKEREKRSNMPGLLLFRRNPATTDKSHAHPEKELLLVFLVGETPTSGINRVAFNAAWNYVDKLADQELPVCRAAQSNSKKCIGILGPSFTGSLASLRLLLDKKYAEPDKPAGYETFVISGAVTGEAATTKLREDVHFCTTIETDQNTWRVFHAFLSYLSKGSIWGEDHNILEHLALLGEDETEYGSGKRVPDDLNKTHILTLRFPRGIARLRNSSEELPGSANPPRNPAYPDLPLILRDTGQDTISAFSRQQSPVSQEAVMMELVSALKRERIRYVGIVATDSLDALFLTRAIHALAPNLRIVLFSSDLLFAHESQRWGLTGVLAVTSYPLISRNQYYSEAMNPRRAQFANDGSEGVYNACRRMLLSARKTTVEQPCSAVNFEPQGAPPKGDYLLDYAAPFADPDVHKPSVWLTILGRSEWWPVAASPVNVHRPTPLLDGPAPASHATGHFFSVEESPQPWYLFFWLTWIGCALHVTIVFLMNIPHRSLLPWRKNRILRGVWKYSYQFVRRLWTSSLLRRLGWGYRPDLERQRRGTLAAASLTVAFACSSLVAAVLASGLKGWQLPVAIVVGFTAVVQALWAAVGIKEAPYRRFWLGVVMTAVIAVVWGVVYAARSDPPGHARFFAGYRAVHLESGASPVLPVVFLLLTIYLFCWFRLSRLRISEERHSQQPVHKLGRDAPEPFPDFTISKRAMPELGRWHWTLLFLTVVAWWLFFNPPRALATVEGAFYDSLINGLTSVVIFMLAGVLLRFSLTWRALRKLLQDLERHPLRYAFSRLPKDFSWTTVWAGDPRPQLIMPARSLDVLRMVPDAKLRAQVRLIEAEFQFLKKTDKPFSKVPHHVEKLNQALNTAFDLLSVKRQPFWRKGVSDTIASREKHDEAPAEWRDAPLPVAQDEFIALRFVTFIGYTLRIMRGFLEFITYGFILMVIALALYPFEGRRYVETAILFIFVVAGATVAIVFAQMDRDPLLSRLSETKPNELGRNFVFRLVSFGALPLLTVLASQVPDIGNFLLRWLQPALQSAK
jgi:hypothetical protein